MYEVIFSKATLGFTVKNLVKEGTIVVNRIVDKANVGKIFLGDTIMAINGAPLGFVTDHKLLARKIKPLKRPIKITFKRENKDESIDRVRSEQRLHSAAMSRDMLKQVRWQVKLNVLNGSRRHTLDRPRGLFPTSCRAIACSRACPR